eukprot:10760891-Alexandrium_andersonii.AAC.1
MCIRDRAKPKAGGAGDARSPDLPSSIAAVNNSHLAEVQSWLADIDGHELFGGLDSAGRALGLRLNSAR